MLLHAWKISLPHPVTGDTIEIIASPPPELGL
jgi:23S rRNA-/tRNA-specific pseudouridylate synthase